MSLDFPTNPNVGDRHTAINGIVYEWNGSSWIVISRLDGIVQDTTLNGFMEIGDTTLASVAGILTLPMNNKPAVVNLTENITFATVAITPPLTGASKTVLIQGAVDYTVDYPAAWWWPDGSPGVMPTGQGSRMTVMVEQLADGTIEARSQIMAQSP